MFEPFSELRENKIRLLIPTNEFYIGSRIIIAQITRDPDLI
jgi:hypothetical protein